MESSRQINLNGVSPLLNDSPKSKRNSRKRIRMSRCGKCIGCNAVNCGKCYKCLDMIKYGGPGTLKQACERRQCTNPQMPGSSPLNSLTSSVKGMHGNICWPQNKKIVKPKLRSFYSFNSFINSILQIQSTMEQKTLLYLMSLQCRRLKKLIYRQIF